MARKVSAAMQKAERLVKAGMKPAEAARKTGLSGTAIYQAAWYKAHRATALAQPPEAKP